MGTTKCGRYLNTYGNKGSVCEYALVHSNEGKFKKMNPKHCKNGENPLKLVSGGHGEDGIKLLEKYEIEYHIKKTFPNGVRVGNISKHDNKLKQKGTNMSWFPVSWNKKMIKKAGEHVASLHRNKNSKDGVPLFGVYKGVRVGIILTNGQIGTVFPDSDQTNIYSRSKK